MNTTKIFKLLFSVLLFTSCSKDDEYRPVVNEYEGVKVYIAPYYNNKTSCITLTFDDGTYDQYANAVPKLEERKLPATFFINGKTVGPITSPYDNHMDERCVKDLSDRGFEVSNHTWSHTKLTTISLAEARKDIIKNDDAIEAWTGKRPKTFSFPNNARTEALIKIAEEGRTGSRTFETGFGQTLRKNTYNDLKNWTDNCIKKKNWSVGMFHGIKQGYDSWTDPTILWRFFDYLVSRQNEIWVANFNDAVSYIKERDNSKLQLYSNKAGTLKIMVSTNLDTNLFTHPLTLVVEKKGVVELVNVLPNKSVELPGKLSVR